jgi:hypothetical protein
MGEGINGAYWGVRAQMHSRTRAGLMAVLAVATLALETGGALAQAQTTPPPRRHIPRITVVPLNRYHRECDFWLALERRPSGDVYTPQQHCWWAR